MVASEGLVERKPLSAPEAVDQIPLSSRSSVAVIPSRRLRASSVARPGCRREDLLGGQRQASVHPGEHGAHVPALQSGGMEKRREQGFCPFRPVGMLDGALAADEAGTAGGHERRGRRQRAEPGRTALQRRPADLRQAVAAVRSSLKGRKPSTDRPLAHADRGVDDVGLGRRGDDGAGGSEDVGDDERRSFSPTAAARAP